MFKEKKKENYYFKECLSLFNEDKDDLSYNDMKILYYEIKKYYNEKLKHKEIIIGIEKIRLEANSGKYDNNVTNYALSTFMGFAFIIFTMYIEDTFKLDVWKAIFKDVNLTNSLIVTLSKGIVFIFMIIILSKIIFDKKTKKTRCKEMLNNIKLKVLEDIEKEMKEEEEKILKFEQNQAKLQSDNKIDFIYNSVVPAMFEVSATLLKKDSWIKKIFKKKK